MPCRAIPFRASGRAQAGNGGALVDLAVVAGLAASDVDDLPVGDWLGVGASPTPPPEATPPTVRKGTWGRVSPALPVFS